VSSVVRASTVNDIHDIHDAELLLFTFPGAIGGALLSGENNYSRVIW